MSKDPMDGLMAGMSMLVCLSHNGKQGGFQGLDEEGSEGLGTTLEQVLNLLQEPADFIVNYQERKRRQKDPEMAGQSE